MEFKVGGYQTGSSLVKSIAAAGHPVYYILNEDSIDYIEPIRQIS